MSTIRFETTPLRIGDWTILLLPKSASAKLPSRGMTLVEGTINGVNSRIVLEPDGRGSHWFRIGTALRKSASINADNAVAMAIEPSKDWPEPELPADLNKALAKDRQANALWTSLTPMARWDWLRWIRGTNYEDTRIKHIRVALSKLKAGERRPCCFNRSMCTEPDVSKNGVLIEPMQATK